MRGNSVARLQVDDKRRGLEKRSFAKLHVRMRVSNCFHLQLLKQLPKSPLHLVTRWLER